MGAAESSFIAASKQRPVHGGPKKQAELSLNRIKTRQWS